MTSAGTTRASKRQPRIAVIGCGAIARSFHAPALGRHRDIARNAVFVDPDIDRAKALAAETGSAEAVSDVGAVLGSVDGAIVCVPHHLHVPVCQRLLDAGIHVLCEKPLAERPEDVRQLVARANSKQVSLAVNNMRRAYPAMREIARRIHEGMLGEIREITIVWGERFDWDAASGFYFGEHAHNRGALLDRGAHVLDLVCWWLRGQPEVVEYRDDSEGGSEARAELSFRHGDTTGRLEFGWLAKYENAIEIAGDRASVRCGIYDWNSFFLIEQGQPPRPVHLPAPVSTSMEIGHLMIDNFLDVTRGLATPIVPGAAVLDSIAMMAQAYAVRTALPQPWHDVYRRVIDV